MNNDAVAGPDDEHELERLVDIVVTPPLSGFLSRYNDIQCYQSREPMAHFLGRSQTSLSIFLMSSSPLVPPAHPTQLS